MALVEGNKEVETLATKAPAQSLAHRACLGGSHRRRQNSNTQVRESLVDLISEDAIAIVDDEATGMAARQRFPELRQRPFRRRMGSDVLVELLAGEVAGHDPFGRIADEGPLTLLRVRRAHRSVAVEVLADPARGERNGQFQLQLVGDAL